MVHFKVSAVLPIPAHIFFVERDSAAFRSLVAKVMKLGGLEIHDGWMDGDVEVYKFVTRPDIDKFVPKKLQHYLPGGTLFYIDLIEYDPERLKGSPYKLNVTSIPPIFPNKAHIRCLLTIEEETRGTCRQTLEGDVDIHIFGLGRLAESIIADNLKKVYSGIPQIVERWVEFRNEVLKHPQGHDILVSGRPDNHDIKWINQQIADLLQEPLKPAYDLAEAPGMTSQLHEGKTAKDAVRVMEANKSGKDEPDRGFNLQNNSQKAAQPSTPSSASSGASPGQQGQGAERIPSVTSASQLTPRNPQGRAELGEDDTDEEAFYDASEDLPWSEEDRPEYASDATTSEQIAQDHKAATTWYRTFKKAKKNEASESESVPVDHDVTAHVQPPQGAKPLKNNRFSAEYKQEYDTWTGFWDKQQVPEQQDVPELRARLAHLLGLGAAWGLLKPHSSKPSRHSSAPHTPASEATSQTAHGSSAPAEGSWEPGEPPPEGRANDTKQKMGKPHRGVRRAFKSCFVSKNDSTKC